jgi:hypothetical protein
VCGFGAGVLQVVPFVKSFSCCLIMPIAAVAALILDQKANMSTGKMTRNRAVSLGLLTGLFAALFGTLFELFITLITKQNDIVATFPELQRMIDTFPVSADIKQDVIALVQNVRNEITERGFSWFYTLSLIVNNFIVDPVFGTIGGLLGQQIINNRNNNSQNNFYQ